MIIRLLICLLCLSAAAYAEGPPGAIAHWKLDGDPRDAISPGHDGIILGRAEFVDSTITGSGKAIWFNGVDTAIRVDNLPNPATGDFSVSAWICPLEVRAGGLLGHGDARYGWSLQLLPNNAIRFTIGRTNVDTIPNRIGFGQWYHLVAICNRTAGVSLYVNGELAQSSKAAPRDITTGTLPTWIGCSSEKGPFFTGLMDDVQLFNRPISADEVAKLTDAGLPWLRRRTSAQTPFAGHFSLVNDDVVVLVGGEDQNASQAAGYLETLLTAGSAGKHVLFRDMAWEGDTVFEQWRILNFGPWPRQFERVGASVIFVQFGQMESLKGKAGVEEFAAAYDRLLEEFQHRTQRIVVVSPTPFQKSAPLFPDLSAHNEDLKLYADAAKKLAEKRGLLYVDLYSPLLQSQYPHPLTRDGAHLTEFGQCVAARETARQLGFTSTDPVSPDDQPKFERQELEQLRGSIREKNALWLRYWRPTNWAFLAGDRITQPSSRDYQDSRIRWQPEELQQYAPLIMKQEGKIAEEAKKLGTP